MRKIAVTTPAGQVGRHVVKALLREGESVVAIGLERHREKMKELIDAGVEFRVAGQDDSKALAKAFEGVSALFWLTPPATSMDTQQWYELTAQAASTAIQKSSITHVVNVSSIGAGLRSGLGTVSFIESVEKILNQSAKNIVHLRPGCFMENLLLQVKPLSLGYYEYPYHPDHDIPWISTKDIGEKAATYLARAGWTGQWYPSLMGPENLTCAQLAVRLSSVLARPVEYRQISIEELRGSLNEMGMSPSSVHDLILTMQALGDPDGIYAQPRTHDAFTPTTIEDFVKGARVFR